MEKPLVWVASTRKELKSLPRAVRRFFGFALDLAQRGGKHDAAKPLHGFRGAAVLEIVSDDRDGTYRAVYTIRFRRAVYVLYVFQKKSKRGTATPKDDMELIRSRLAAAADHAKEMGYD